MDSNTSIDKRVPVQALHEELRVRVERPRSFLSFDRRAWTQPKKHHLRARRCYRRDIDTNKTYCPQLQSTKMDTLACPKDADELALPMLGYNQSRPMDHSPWAAVAPDESANDGLPHVIIHNPFAHPARAVSRFFEHVELAALSRRIHLVQSQVRSPLGFVQTEARDSLVLELTESNWPKPASFRPTTEDLHLHCHHFHFGTTHCTEALLHGLGSSRCIEILQLIAQCLFVSTKYYHLRRQCYQNMSLQHHLNMVRCHIRAHAGRCCIHINQSTFHSLLFQWLQTLAQALLMSHHVSQSLLFKFPFWPCHDPSANQMLSVLHSCAWILM